MIKRGVSDCKDWWTWRESNFQAPGTLCNLLISITGRSPEHGKNAGRGHILGTRLLPLFFALLCAPAFGGITITSATQFSATGTGGSPVVQP
jgi:hypothetical protein